MQIFSKFNIKVLKCCDYDRYIIQGSMDTVVFSSISSSYN